MERAGPPPPVPDFYPRQMLAGGPSSVDVWNLMGGAIDATLIPIIVEMLGISDVESLMYELFAIRDKQALDAKLSKQ